MLLPQQKAEPPRTFDRYPFSIRDGNREEWDPAFRDPLIQKWLATPPGPSWRTLTEGSKEPEWTVICDKDGKPIGRQRVAADGVEFYF